MCLYRTCWGKNVQSFVLIVFLFGGPSFSDVVVWIGVFLGLVAREPVMAFLFCLELM